MRNVSILLLAALAAGAAGAEPDWSKVAPRKITLFYPGQAGYEWVMNKADHSAVPDIVDKKRPCARCHEGDAAEIGDKIVAGKPLGSSKTVLDSVVPKGKSGSLPVLFQAAHDGSRIWFRFEWNSPKGGEGRQDPKNEVKLTMMFDGGGTVEGASLVGCWGTCHMDLDSMPDASDAARTHAKAKALGWGSGVTKYLAESRTALSFTKPRGGWDKLKPDADVAAALKAGKFLDLMQFRSGKGEKPVDGHVLDARHMGGGKSLLKAEGRKEGDKWVVVFERTLAGGAAGDHTIGPDKIHAFGFAIHEDHASERFHYVSLGYQFALDKAVPEVKSHINVVKQ
jgi:cytochrome c-type protein NapC